MSIEQINDEDKLAKEAIETLQTFPDINRMELYNNVVRHFLKTNYPKIFPNIEERKNEEPKIDTISFRDHREIFRLVNDPNTPRESIDLIINELNKLFPIKKDEITFHNYQDYWEAIALNPNTDPKMIEENIENILKYCFNLSQRGGDRFNIFLTRPDITPETIQKISKTITINDYGTLSQFAKLVYNPNISKELLKELLKNKVIREFIAEQQKFNFTARNHIALYPELVSQNKK